MRAVLTVLAALALLGPAARAGEVEPEPEPSRPQRPSRPLSLQEAIALALQHNLVLAAEKINPKVAQTVVVEQEAVFDPSAYGEFNRSKSKEQSTTGLFGQHQHLVDGTVGVAKLLAPGTLVDVHVGGNREWNDFPFTEINPSYTEEWGVNISQPLLRGFGVRVNTAGIATAVNERRIAQAQLRQVGLDTVADVTKGYWGLVLAVRARELIQRSLDRARGLQREVGIRVDAGALARRPNVAQAQAEVAVRQEGVVKAQQAIRDAEDALKVITDLAADDAIWDVALLPTTAPPEAVPALDPASAVATALAKRPDYRQAQLTIDNQEIVLYVRRNELKPKLDLTASYGNSGLNGSWEEADHDFRTFDYYQWAIGLSFEYPLGNRAARARFRKAKLRRTQARINLTALERQIQLELRNAVRAVHTSVESLRAAEQSVQAEEARLSAETEKFKQGQDVTTQDLLDAQAALAEAERRELAALIALNQALVDVDRLRGTLLEKHNVTWEDE
ncbi:MAG: TolC family protein [bacterium]